MRRTDYFYLGEDDGGNRYTKRACTEDAHEVLGGAGVSGGGAEERWRKALVKMKMGRHEA